MRSIIIFLLMVATTPLWAQFAVGSISLTYTDATRNRDLPFEMMYPASTDGNGVPCADGVFPYVVIAHGFSMQASDYTYLAQSLAASGYIVLQLATESGFAPSHADYGLDILYLATHFREENVTDGSWFAGHVMSKAGVIGHSMGGGSAWLAAAQEDGNIDCLVGLAPAETNPSAIDAAPEVVTPAMILSGSSDAVTPPAQNHQPIYDETASSCKVFVNVLEGSHCGFADDGTLCQFGEFGFNGLATTLQQSITQDLVKPWMDWHLKGLTDAAGVIDSYDEIQPNTEIVSGCIVSSIQANALSNLQIFPNPSDNKISVWGISEVRHLVVINGEGRRVDMICHQRNSDAIEMDVSYFHPGIYVAMNSSTGARVRFVVY
jgi:predicted dienelactone hydrolase